MACTLPFARARSGELLERWFDHGEVDWSATVVRSYRSISDRVILPRFGITPLRNSAPLTLMNRPGIRGGSQPWSDLITELRGSANMLLAEWPHDTPMFQSRGYGI